MMAAVPTPSAPDCAGCRQADRRSAVAAASQERQFSFNTRLPPEPRGKRTISLDVFVAPVWPRWGPSSDCWGFLVLTPTENQVTSGCVCLLSCLPCMNVRLSFLPSHVSTKDSRRSSLGQRNTHRAGLVCQDGVCRPGTVHAGGAQ